MNEESVTTETQTEAPANNQETQEQSAENEAISENEANNGIQVMPSIEELKQRLADSKKSEPEKKPETESKQTEESADEQPAGDGGEAEEEGDDDDVSIMYKKDAKTGKFIPKGKAVPLGQHKKLRDEVAELKAQLAQEKSQKDESAAAILKLLGEKQKIEQENDAGGSVDEDDEFVPLDEEAQARNDKKIKSLESRIEELVKKLDEKSQQQSTDAALQQFWNKSSQEKKEFAADNPDFDDAVLHLYKAKFEENKLINGGDEDAAHKAAYGAMATIAGSAYNRGLNTAEALYTMSQSFGYVKKAVKPSGEKSTAPNLKAIEETRKKTAGVKDIRGENMQLAGGAQPVSLAKFNEEFALKDDKGRVIGVDKAKLKAYRQSLGQQAQA